MAIVGGFDIHRRQVTFDYVDTVTGQVRRGRIAPACRETLRQWLERFAGVEDVTFAVEGCTGWRFVAEGRVPCSWVPPEHVCELRALLQLYADLRQEHVAWAQRIHATLFHLGAPSLAGQLSDPQIRARLAAQGIAMGLSPAGAQAVQVAVRMLDRLEAELVPVHAQIVAFARRQPGCKALARELYGAGWLVAAVIWAFLGDTRRFSSSAQAVRHSGLDVTVYSSDGKRAPGRSEERRV